MLEIIVCLLLFVLICSLIIWLLSRLDCDLQLLSDEKFGHSITDRRGKIVWNTRTSSGMSQSLAYLLSTAGVK